MEEKWLGESQRRGPFDLDSVLAAQFGKDWWPRERSVLNHQK